MTLLATLLSELVAERPVKAITEAQYDRSIRCFSDFLTRPAVVDDLTPLSVNAWLAKVAKAAQPRTVLNRKRGITPVWNYAAERGLTTSYETRRLRRVSVPHSIVSAWSVDQVEALFAAARDLPGRTVCGIPASVLMGAVCSLAYETGYRPGDWRTLQWEHIDFERRLVTFVQSKTGNPHTAAFSRVTAKCLKKLQAYGREAVVPVGRWSIRRWELQLFQLASDRYGFTRRRGQGLGTLRKSHATSVYLEHGELAAALSLGHVSGTLVARRHYIDSSAASEPVRIEIPHAKRTATASARTSDSAKPKPDHREQDRAVRRRPGRVAG